MRYSFEFKKKAIELYRQGQWIDPPSDISNFTDFRKEIRRWVRIADANGIDALCPKTSHRKWTADEKLELVMLVIAGCSIKETAIRFGINHGMLSHWVKKYKIYGYNGLVEQPKGRKAKEPVMKSKIKNTPLTESEREELIRLRAEVEYFKTENEVIKKEIALRHAKWDEELKAKKQRSSRNSGKKDTN